MKLLVIIALLALSFIASANEPKPVDQVDLKRYLGKWFEQVRLEFNGERGCHCSEAQYSERSESTINVENTCIRDGRKASVSGYAYPVDETNAKLVVKFPYSTGDYWITELDTNYQWAVVTNPSRNNYFILSREEDFDKEILERLVEKAKQDGYPVNEFVYREYFCGYC